MYISLMVDEEFWALFVPWYDSWLLQGLFAQLSKQQALQCTYKLCNAHTSSVMYIQATRCTYKLCNVHTSSAMYMYIPALQCTYKLCNVHASYALYSFASSHLSEYFSTSIVHIYIINLSLHDATLCFMFVK